MKKFRQRTLAWMAILAPAAASAQFTESTNYAAGMAIPDNNASGIAATAAFNSSQIYQITDLEVRLNIAGGFNGDYYAHLSHESGFSVLLNRVGRDTDNLYGYPDGGFDVTLDDQASNGDIHTYRSAVNPNGGVLTGVWAPDARTADPGVVLTASPRSVFLNSFVGLDPNGIWTLFVADLEPGSVGTLQSWGLTITGLPEPSTCALLLLGAGPLLRRRLT